MKKIFSMILALTMILAIVSAMGISVSAASGDVLYSVNFKGDDKFAPVKFDCAQGDEAIEVVPSDDGKSVTATYISGTKAKAFWGGAFKGLTYGAGKQYTISMKVAVGYSNAEKTASGNAGVYINMPANTDLEYLKSGGSTTVFGYYGCPTIRNVLSYGAGNKAAGYYISRNEYITDVLFDVDEAGFVDMTFVVDGANVKLFINGIYFDEADAFINDTMQVGFALYLYNTGASVTVKDAVVKEGIILPANASYPEYYKAAAPLTNYEAARTGDVLYAADFANVNAPFNHMFKGDHVEKYTVTTDPANPNYIKFELGDKDSGTYYGSAVQGLFITEDTRYTTEWKVKSGNKNTGFCFAMPIGTGFTESYNIYGNFSAEKMSFATEHGSTKIENVNTPGKDYVGVTDLGYDADGYATFRVEMDGYIATVYYLNNEGKWISYNVINMAESYKYDRKATYVHDQGLAVVLGFYLHNNKLVAEYKDMVVYKGLTVSDPEGLRDPVITEPPVDEPSKPTGDSAWIYVVIAAVAVIGTAVVSKKREN